MKPQLNLLILLFFFTSFTLFSQTEFITIWNTSNTSTGSSAANEITIPTNPAYTYNYTVDWGDSNSNNNVTGDITHTYTSAATYTITIRGDFPSVYFNDSGDKLKIIEILQWGDIQWQTMENAFYGCENLNFDAIDKPDLSQVTSLHQTFRDCSSFNGIINNWDVSNITDISGIFYKAEIFNRPLANWNTSAITDMSYAFYEANLFNEPLDNWKTDSVTNMSNMFNHAEEFNQNINNWNVSQVTDMSDLFYYAREFDQPLNNWDVSKVTNMSGMFYLTRFNQPINNWIVDNVTDMSGMFRNCPFNQPLDNWNVSNVTTLASMFAQNNSFNQPLNDWDVSSVTNMSNTFGSAGSLKAFNQPLDQWDVSNVTNMSGMFESSSFNQPINNWDVSSVTNMQGMFSGWASTYITTFNQPLDQWDVSSVINMSDMFEDSSFNQNIEGWDVSNVTNMSNMFYNATQFNQPLNNWTTTSLTKLDGMFGRNPLFNQTLDNWNTASVTNMSGTFANSGAFDQDLGSWNIASVSNMTSIFSNSVLSQENYDATLIGWATQAVTEDVSLGAIGVKYCDGRLARQELIDNYNWNITGDIVNCTNVFCTTITNPAAGDTNVPANSNIRWEAAPNADGYYIDLEAERAGVRSFVNISGTPANNYDVGNVQILTFTNEFTPGDTIFITVTPYNDEGPAVGCEEFSFTVVPSWANSTDAYKITIDTRLGSTFGNDQYNFKMQKNGSYSYNYSIDWGDNEYNNNVTNNITHTYNTPGIYTIAIIGDFPAPYFYYGGDADEIISIDQWGTHVYQSMQRGCFQCENMEYNATDFPNLSQVTDMSEIFRDARLFNGNINDWNVSNVTDMSSAFYNNHEFNQPLDNWDVSKVTDMSSMFYSARKFDQPLNSWITNAVTNMSSMFSGAKVFNQPIDNWDVSKVTSMARMFSSTDEFNQNINNWDVSSVTSMTSMFNNAKVYNQPLNNWTVDNVTNMSSMFNSAIAFNQPLNNWNVDYVTSMESMFNSAEVFNQPINSWNVSRVTTMASMFNKALIFNQPLDNWNVDSVVNMSSMFQEAEAFNQPLDTWNVSAVANMTSMFENALLFDQTLNSWDVSSVTLMPSMFEGAAIFDSPISDWNVASVTSMNGMFKDAITFNQAIQNWDTGEVLDMEEMFQNASIFNQSIDSWNVSFVKTMESMFENAIAYNQSMNSWNVASVTTMEDMFHGATVFNSEINAWNVRAVKTMEEMFSDAIAFNQNINNWRISGVNNMDYMFNEASVYNQPMNLWNLGNVSMRSTFYNATSLDQNLAEWNVTGVTNMLNMLDNTALSRENYDKTLIAWSEQTLTPSINLGANGLLYCDALEERQSMIDTYGWSFSGDILDCPIPECTQLIAPLNGTTDVPVNTNLSWEPALYARGYTLTVVTQPGNITIVNNETINNNTAYEFSSDFAGEETVEVTITPFNDEGTPISCTTESFTISNNATPTEPNCTNLTSPLSGSIDVSINTNLEWTPIANADGYRVSVGTNTGLTDIIDNEDIGNVTNFELPVNLPEDTTIYVTVTPYNSIGDAMSCSEENFKTELIPVAPICTGLIQPLNGAVNVPIDTNITWNAAPSATGYLLTVGTTAGGIEILNSIDLVGNITSYDFTDDLPTSRLIFVSITPYNEVGDAESCIEESFKTGSSSSTDPPDCTTLNSPTNLATDIPVDTQITWDATPNATGYFITITSTSGTNTITDFDNGIGTSYDPTSDFDNGDVVTVTITPYNANGSATSCTSESFTIVSAVTPVPNCTMLNSPTNGITDVAVNTNISWDAVTDATGYFITITSASGTNAITDFDNGISTSYNPASDFDNGDVVTVTITPYNANGSATSCTSESFTIVSAVTPVPNCTMLNSPTNGTTDVAVNTNISWDTATDATGYFITITSTSGTNAITDFDNGTSTTYDPASDFDNGDVVTVTITPYNANGSATSCTSESFTIVSAVTPVPNCSMLNIPTNGTTDVAVNTNISWDAVTDATGYFITITSSSGTNAITDFDNGTSTTFTPNNNFANDDEVLVTITPYNANGNATGCTTERFSIELQDIYDVKYGFSPDGDGINDFWKIEGMENHPNNIVSIFNRWGDMVFQTQGYNNTTNVFNGVANKKTKMGANVLPEGTYFFKFTISETHNFKKLQGFVVIKR